MPSLTLRNKLELDIQLLLSLWKADPMSLVGWYIIEAEHLQELADTLGKMGFTAESEEAE